MSTARLVAASATVVAAVTQLLWRRWRRIRARSKFDGLDGVVSFSSRLIAAARAIESMRPDALFIDPFAKLLAGPKALSRHQAFDEADKSVNVKTGAVTTTPGGAATAAAAATLAPPADAAAGQQQQQQPQQLNLRQPQTPTQAQSYPGRQVSRLVLRTVFFDEATLLVTGQPAPRSSHALAAVSNHIQQHNLKQCRQVVMLGAGMDTRPWRLPLNPQLNWFELDKQDVLAAKQAALRDAGALFGPSVPTDNKNSSSSSSNSKDGSVVQQHPLRVGRWVCASADLQKQGWVGKLQEAGLDPSQPTVWAAEGLLYYLEPDSVAPMLKEAAQMSPKGSMIIANFMTDEGLQLLNVSPLTAKANTQGAGAGAGTGTTTTSTTAPTNGNATAAAADSTTSTGGPAAAAPAATGPAAATAAGDAASSSTKGRPPASDLQKTGLLSHFKWGCPDNVEEFFAECGWQLLVRYSLTQGADAYGWTVQHTPASRVRTDSQEVQFVVGVVMK